MGDLVTQASVSYRPAAPDSHRFCGSCVMFIYPHACDLVQPPIYFDGVCDRWAPHTS